MVSTGKFQILADYSILKLLIFVFRSKYSQSVISKSADYSEQHLYSNLVFYLITGFY